MRRNLRVEPLGPEHAPALFRDLVDPAIYAYIPGSPPATPDALAREFRRLAAGSPDGTAQWLNWVAFADEGPVGTLQATIRPDATALVGYTIFPRHWGRGFGRAGCEWVLRELFERRGVRAVRAHVHRENLRSVRLLRAVGLARIDPPDQPDVDPSDLLFGVSAADWVPALERVPRVATERLLLREPRASDFPRYASYATDVSAPAPMSLPLTARDAWRRFHSGAGYWIVQDSGWWMVDDEALGVVGIVGVFRRELGPELEIGWMIYPPYWNRGFASEAAKAALRFASMRLGAGRVSAFIRKDNAPSIRVAAKIGMRLDGEVDFYGSLDWRYVWEPPPPPT